MDAELLRGLAPCPFCGEAADQPYKSGKSRNKNVLWDVTCSDTLCGARRIGSTEAEAVARWNQRAALSVAQGQGWRPIESAPRDGTDVLTWHDYGTEVANHRHKDYGKRGYVSIQSAFDAGHVFPSELANSGSVTFWQPLPTAPAQPDGVE